MHVAPVFLAVLLMATTSVIGGDEYCRTAPPYIGNIRPIGDTSRLYKLRPSIYNYICRNEHQNFSRYDSYGVDFIHANTVWPEAVAIDKDGNLAGFKSNFLATAQLNELIKLNELAQNLAKRIATLEKEANNSGNKCASFWCKWLARYFRCAC